MWPENAKKSQPHAATSAFRCATPCAPSTSTRAPAAWASPQIARTSFSTPSTLDTHATATHFARCAARPWRKASRSSRPSGASGITFSVAPTPLTACCHGTQLLWCSMADTQTSSPGPISHRAKPNVARLIAAVVPDVKTISSGAAAPTNSATVARAPS